MTENPTQNPTQKTSSFTPSFKPTYEPFVFVTGGSSDLLPSDFQLLIIVVAILVPILLVYCIRKKCRPQVREDIVISLS